MDYIIYAIYPDGTRSSETRVRGLSLKQALEKASKEHDGTGKDGLIVVEINPGPKQRKRIAASKRVGNSKWEGPEV